MVRTCSASASLICQGAIVEVVAERHRATHPHAFALRSSDLVPDTLARDLPLKLRKGQQHVQRQPPHGAGGVELLRNGDEADTLFIELFHDLGESRPGSG